MKKFTIGLIILICIPMIYIGTHRIVYFSDYKRINVLNAEIYQLKIDTIDCQPKFNKAKLELDALFSDKIYKKYTSTKYTREQLSYDTYKKKLDNIKIKYEKDIIELEYLKNKTKYIN